MQYLCVVVFASACDLSKNGLEISSSLFLSSPRCILNKTTRHHRPLRYPVVPLCTLPCLPPRKLPALPARLLMLSCSTNLISTEHCWLDVMKLKYGPQNIMTAVPAHQPKNQPFWNKCSVWVCFKYARNTSLSLSWVGKDLFWLKQRLLMWKSVHS